MAVRVYRHWEHWMPFTMQVYAFVWEPFVLPLCKVTTSKREKPLYLPKTLPMIVWLSPNFFPTLRLSLISPRPLELVFNLTLMQLGLMLSAFPTTLFTDVSPWSIPVPVVRFDLTKLKKKNLKLIQSSIKTFFLSCLLLFPTTVWFLLMVLNAVIWLCLLCSACLYVSFAYHAPIIAYSSSYLPFFALFCSVWLFVSFAKHTSLIPYPSNHLTSLFALFYFVCLFVSFTKHTPIIAYSSSNLTLFALFICVFC